MNVLMWLWVVAIYAAFATVVIILLQHRRSREANFLQEAWELSRREFSPLQRLQALTEVAKIRQADTPWFERSISTIGVIAFFSMLVATGLQTLKSSSESVRAEQLEKEIKQLQGQRAEYAGVVADLAGAVVAQYQQSGHLDDAGLRILKGRLRTIEDDPSLSHDQIVEGFDAAMIAGQYAEAVRLLRRHSDLLDRTKILDVLTLAEFYYITNDSTSGRALLRRVNLLESTLPVAARKRAIVLNAALDPGGDNYVGQLAALLRLDLDDASQMLEREKAKLKEATLDVRNPNR